MRFGILLRGLLVLLFTTLSLPSFADQTDVVYRDGKALMEHHYVELPVPSYADADTVRQVCELPDHDYNKIESLNSGPMVIRYRICSEQTGGLAYSLEKHIEVCEITAQSCIQNVRQMGSNPTMVEDCRRARVEADKEMAEAAELIAKLKRTTKSCMARFTEECDIKPDSPYCAGKVWKPEDEKDKPKRSRGERLARRVEKFEKRAEKLERNLETATELGQMAKAARALRENRQPSSSGETNVQQTYGLSPYQQYQQSRVAGEALKNDSLAAPKASEPPRSSAPTTPGLPSVAPDNTEVATSGKPNVGSGALEGLKGFGRGVQRVVTDQKVLATTGLLRGQYLEKKESKRSQRERQQLLDQASAVQSQKEVQNNLRILDKTNTGSGGGSSRPNSNAPTAVGQGAQPASVASRNPQQVQGQVQQPLQRESASPGGAGKNQNAAPAKATTATANSPVAGTTGTVSTPSGGTAATSVSSTEPDLEKYTKSRGFFGALARAFGYKKKNKGSKDIEKNGAAAARASEASENLAASSHQLQKHWNQTLGRVEMVPARGLASVGSDEPGLTKKHRSIFGSICNRYTAFREQSRLGDGRAICPGN